MKIVFDNLSYVEVDKKEYQTIYNFREMNDKLNIFYLEWNDLILTHFNFLNDYFLINDFSVLIQF